jgi:hypothetical protein
VSSVDDQNLFFVKTEVFSLDIIELAVNNERTDNQNNGGGKLKNNQRIPEITLSQAVPFRTFQDGNWVETGQEKCRITARY